MSHKKTLSLVVPTGGSISYFFWQNLFNIVQTVGDQIKEIDLIFLTAKNVPAILDNALIKASKEYPFRILRGPDYTSHLGLIDWAMRHGQLQEWVLLQHNDTYWIKTDWYKAIRNQIDANPECIAIAVQGEECRYQIDGQEVPHMHDYVGVYKKKYIVDQNLSFTWGQANSLKWSSKARDMINQSRITSKYIKNPMGWNYGLDGSDLISIEFALHCPDKIIYFPFRNYMMHPWSIIRPAIKCSRKHRTLKLPITYERLMKKKKNFATLSLVSSLYYEASESLDLVIPWAFFGKELGFSEENIRNSALFKAMTKYAPEPESSVGLEETFGLKYVELKEGYFVPKNGELEVALISSL